MPTPAAARIASALQRRRSNSRAAPSMTSETAIPTPTRIGGVTHPRLAAITNSRTTPSAVATPQAHDIDPKGVDIGVWLIGHGITAYTLSAETGLAVEKASISPMLYRVDGRRNPSIVRPAPARVGDSPRRPPPLHQRSDRTLRP